MAVLAAAGGLQSLLLTIMWRQLGTFEAVAQANLDLSDVSILFHGLTKEEHPGSLAEVLADIVTSFSASCQSLASIRVEGGHRRYKKRRRFDEVANACIRLTQLVCLGYGCSVPPLMHYERKYLTEVWIHLLTYSVHCWVLPVLSVSVKTMND